MAKFQTATLLLLAGSLALNGYLLSSRCTEPMAVPLANLEAKAPPIPTTTERQIPHLAPHSEPTPATPLAPVSPPNLPAPAEQLEQLAGWRVNWRLSQIEQIVALTPEQRSAVENYLRSEAERQALSGSDLATVDQNYNIESAVEQALGPEFAQNFRTERSARQERRAARSREEELVVLNGILKLQESQYQQLQQTLVAVDDQLRPQQEAVEAAMSLAMQSHSGAPVDRITLQSRYQKLKEAQSNYASERKRILVELTRSFLTDEQLNKLLEREATDE